jgi:hypothetical protein
MPIRAASSDRLDQRRASFETAASRPPQDEHISQCHQHGIPHAEERPKRASRSTHDLDAALRFSAADNTFTG